MLSILHSHFSSTLLTKNNSRYFKNKQKKMCVYSWDYIINQNENKDEMKKIPHSYDINRPKSRCQHKYSIYKKCPGVMMLICIK